jgi:hypothetical protein
MKFRYAYIILLLAIIALPACNSLLDKDPLGRLDADQFFLTADDAEQAVNTAYSPLLINNNNNNFYWVLGVVASDDAIAGGTGDRPGINDIDVMNHSPATQELNDLWKLNYAGIVQANLVIEKTPLIDADQVLKDRIIGEALFLRSYYHFLLAQVFGDIPMILEIQAPDEVFVSRTPRNLVWEQVAADAATAANLLPVSYTGSNIGRATKGAALALRAKAFLYLKNYDGVINTVNEIKNLGEYALQASYENNWLDSTQNNSESVWEIQHTNLELGVGNNLNQWWASKKVADGYGFAEVTQDFVAAIEPGDPRLRFTVARHNEPYFGYT